MKTLHILIVDDEEPARLKLRRFLAGVRPGATLSEASNAREAMGQIAAARPDLVFLDIQMPGMNGFELIRAVGAEQMPPVIFVTAYDQYALQAFEVHAIDYLLKPFDEDRFQQAWLHGLDQLRYRHDSSKIFSELLAGLENRSSYLQRISVQTGRRLVLVPVAEIQVFAAEDKYVRLHTAEKTFLIRDTLNHLEARLDPLCFARIHRSHMVNLEEIQEISPRSHGDCEVRMNNGMALTLSRRYRENVFGRKG